MPAPANWQTTLELGLYPFIIGDTIKLFLAASLFVAAAIGSGIGWLLAPALASLGIAILSLTWLAISSDTNA